MPTPHEILLVLLDQTLNLAQFAPAEPLAIL
jgi:hypothetical protein